jgi:protein-tyrosine phosphatase
MRLLFVCTGNICRSAAAHALTAAWPAGHLGVTVEAASAGTHAPVGQPVHPLTARALANRGITGQAHSSRRLSAADLQWADVVLTMTTRHREAVLALDPRALRRTYTLREAAALCADLTPHRLALVSPGDRGAVLADALAEVRATRRRPAVENIEDPIDGGAELHARVVDEIAAALRTLLVAISRQVGGSEHDTVRVPRLPPVPQPA